MTIVNADSSSDHLRLETLPLVDLRFLSQSELNSLSLCSDEAFDLNRCDDVVIPKIDRSVFNESAGSRKQTYSRLRLAPRKPQITSIGRRRRCTGLLPVPKPPPNPIDDPERKENKRIVSLLKDLFARDNLIPINRENAESPSLENQVVPKELPTVVVPDGVPTMKKRGRKRKHPLNPNPDPSVKGDDGAYYNGSIARNKVMEIVNRNGVVVNIAALANMEDPFVPELKRRTVGLETEADLLEFLRGLEGQWGSRRKKRKIVDAAIFGDALPNGWKLLLNLKRKEGRFWLNCRRYISPNGQQFVSCKDVSSFLLSVFGPQGESHPNSRQVDENNHAAYKVATADFIHKDDENSREDLSYYSASPIASLSTEHGDQVTLLGTENLAEVEIRDLLECHKCKMSFDEKDAYLEHLLLLHQRSAKKCRLGTSIGDGVIIKDGKYECQFCHKIFHERHRYNGHVGIHVKKYVRSLDPSSGRIAMQTNVEPLSANGAPSGVSKLDTSVDLDKVSSQLMSTSKTDDEMNASSHGKLKVGSIPETSTAKCNYDADETSNQLTSMAKPIDEMKIGSHGKPEVGLIPEIYTAKSNYEMGKGSSELPSTDKPDDELNVDSHDKPEVDSIPETSAAESNYDVDKGSGQLTSRAKPNDEMNVGSRGKPEVGFIPEIATAKSNFDVDKGSSQLTYTAKPEDEMDVGSHDRPKVGSIPETSTAKSNFDMDKGSSQVTYIAKPDDEMKIGSHGKPEVGSIPETSTAKSNYGMNIGSPYGKQYTGDSIPATEPIGELNVGSSLINLAVGSSPENSPSKSKDELNVGYSHGKEDAGANKVDKSLADYSHDKQDGGYKLTDDEVGKIDEADNNADAEFISCSDFATSLSYNEENNTFESYNGRYVLTSTTGEIDNPGLGQEAGSNMFSLAPSNIEDMNGVETVVSGVFSISAKPSKLNEADRSGNSEPESGFSRSQVGSEKDDVTETIGTTDKVNLLQSMVCDTSSPLVQSSGCFPTLNMISDKGLGENDFCSGNQKLENISDFEELRLNDTEPLKFSFVTEQESSSLPEESMDLTYDVDLEQGLHTSVQFEWEAEMDSGQQLSTVCVWCGISFNHESIAPEMQTDSVGFMCPTCKVKISGQLNVLDNGLSIDFDKL